MKIWLWIGLSGEKKYKQLIPLAWHGRKNKEEEDRPHDKSV